MKKNDVLNIIAKSKDIEGNEYKGKLISILNSGDLTITADECVKSINYYAWEAMNEILKYRWKNGMGDRTHERLQKKRWYRFHIFRSLWEKLKLALENEFDLSDEAKKPPDQI